MTGYEALDGNGRWETVEGYGAVVSDGGRR